MGKKKDIVFMPAVIPSVKMGAKHWKVGDQFRTGLCGSDRSFGGSSGVDQPGQCGSLV